MNKLVTKGRYESPFSEMLALLQEDNFLDSFNPTKTDPSWGGNGRSGSNLDGEGSYGVEL